VLLLLTQKLFPFFAFGIFDILDCVRNGFKFAVLDPSIGGMACAACGGDEDGIDTQASSRGEWLDNVAFVLGSFRRQ
jgi:hypothetical protein